MANTATPHTLSHATPPAPGFETLLRHLKNQLQARFPTTGSSHLTEAIAAGLGYNTQAALRANTTFSGPYGALLAHKSFKPELFKQRLLRFGYHVQPDFQVDVPAAALTPPEQYLAWLTELRELEKNPGLVWSRIYALRKNCAEMFARTFDLGRVEDREDKSVKMRWSAGVDHGSCLPNWGAVLNSATGAFVDFPGSDHRRRFCQQLPLAGGRVVEYESAMVSMPYATGGAPPRKILEAAALAGRIGWTCSEHREWSWYAPGQTTLVLFKRSTPHAHMLQAWEHSFKRWMVENRTRLMNTPRAARKRMVDDIIECQHLPLDLVDFEDCRQRYLKEFVLAFYDDDDLSSIFKQLMQRWANDVGKPVSSISQALISSRPGL